MLTVITFSSDSIDNKIGFYLHLQLFVLFMICYSDFHDLNYLSSLISNWYFWLNSWCGEDGCGYGIANHTGLLFK